MDDFGDERSRGWWFGWYLHALVNGFVGDTPVSAEITELQQGDSGRLTTVKWLVVWVVYARVGRQIRG